MVSIWKNLWCLSESKKSTSFFFLFSLRYCKDIANFLFWVLWEFLIISHQKSQQESVGNFRAYLHAKKINFITHFLIKILQRNTKLVILGNLGMPGHTHLKWEYRFEEIFDVYLQAKNKLHSSRFPWDIPKILQTCYFGYFG